MRFRQRRESSRPEHWFSSFTYRFLSFLSLAIDAVITMRPVHARKKLDCRACRSYLLEVHRFAIPIGIFAGLLIAAVLWDGFETIVLPRRVRRRLRLARLFYRTTWLLWSVPARKFLSKGRMESVLAYYGPLSLLALVVVWAAALVFGFGLVNFSLGSSLATYGHPSFVTDLYMSGTTFFTLGLGDVRPVTSAAKLMTVIEAGMGFGFLALLIAYLPAINQSFSRRERDTSMLDARAGSPPSAAGMLERHDHEGGMEELQEQLSQWERWCADLLESHLSFPSSPTTARSTRTSRGWPPLRSCSTFPPCSWLLPASRARGRRSGPSPSPVTQSSIWP